MSVKPKLEIELIPNTCHYSNVRTMVTAAAWDKIRKLSYASANNKCEICGSDGLKQGYKHRLECHEVWDYNNENKIQKLINLVSLCVVCHQVKHIGRAIAIGKETVCFNQLAKINNWNLTQITEHLKASFELHSERSKHEWTLDLSLLNEEPYNLKINTTKKRVFEVKKYKKKKKPITKSTFKKKKTTKRPPKKKP